MTFPECAECPWLPTLLDVERMKAAEPDGSPVDWRRFGWSALEVPNDADMVTARFDYLGTRFLERYAHRMLNSETMERWQTRLQNRFDECVMRYEAMYKMYSTYSADMMRDVVPGRVVTRTSTNEASGSDSNTSSVKSNDTPDTSINSSDDYAGAQTKSDGSVSYGRRDTSTESLTEKVTGDGMIDAINHYNDAYRDIDTQFMAEFENLFLNIWWY